MLAINERARENIRNKQGDRIAGYIIKGMERASNEQKQELKKTA